MRVSLPSTQSLFVEVFRNELRLSTATAFTAKSSSGEIFVLTNRHVTTGRHQETDAPLSSTCAIPNRIVVHHNSKRGLGEYERVEQLLQDEEGRDLWLEHPALGKSADLVAFKLPDNPNIVAYPYEVQYSAHMEIEPAQPVSVVGFPFGERTGKSFAVWATGFVASEPEINHGGRPVFLIDCRSRTGQSGSPVIIQRNSGTATSIENNVTVYQPTVTLLGIYSGRINAESDIGTVWKSYALAELLDYASSLEQA
ncbi:MAG: trypsin-like peptidase domain-containing protein [Candidatus Nitrotoga sp.]